MKTPKLRQDFDAPSPKHCDSTVFGLSSRIITFLNFLVDA